MQAIAAGNWPTLYDPYFYNVSLLLNGDGTNGAQNNTFIDSSSNNFTITRNGNTTQGSFSPYGSNWSVLSTRSVTAASETRIEVSTTTGLGLASNNFCIEMWVYFTSSYTGDGPFCTSVLGGGFITNTWWFGPHSVNSGRVTVYDYNYSTSAPLMAESTNPPINQWTHYALVRNGNSFTIYRNGISSATATFAGAFAGSSSGLMIARAGDAGNTGNTSFGGYLSNLRVVNGSSVYTSNFTPQTSPLTAITNTGLLTLQSNRLIDNSTNAASVTISNGTPSIQRLSPFNPPSTYATNVIGGSGYFDGSGDYLVAPANSAFELTGDFTSSFWYYPTAVTAGGAGIWDQWDNGTGGVGNWQFWYQNTQLYFFYNGNSYILSSTNLTLNQWQYISATRSGSTITLYLNNVSVGTASFSGTVGKSSQDLYLGASHAGAGYNIQGYISDARIVKGSVITGLPTSPVANVTNTSLLTNFTNAGITDLAMINNLETVGNAQVSTSVVKYGTGSLYFDGTGDYLVAPSNLVYAFGTGNFTVEGWINPTSLPDYCTICSTRTNVGTTEGWNIGVTSAGALFLYANSFQVTGASGAVVVNTWTHFAIVRDGTTLTAYINGVQSGSAGSDSNNYARETFWVGITGGVEQPWFGYIDDFRITKGLARYTATFTPPTTALPTY